MKGNCQKNHTEEFTWGSRNLGQLYEKCSQYSEALAIYQEILPLFLSLGGKKHPLALVPQGRIKQVKQKLKRNKKK